MNFDNKENKRNKTNAAGTSDASLKSKASRRLRGRRCEWRLSRTQLNTVRVRYSETGLLLVLRIGKANCQAQHLNLPGGR